MPVWRHRPGPKRELDDYLVQQPPQYLGRRPELHVDYNPPPLEEADMKLSNKEMCELVGLGTVLRWIGRKADELGDISHGEAAPQEVRKVSVTWNPEGTECTVEVQQQIGRCGVRVPCPLDMTIFDRESGNLDMGPEDRTPEMGSIP